MRAAILELVAARGPEKSGCPSEVARRLYPEDWRAHMDEVRAAARELLREGRIRVTQGEAELAAEGEWRGAIRVREALCLRDPSDL